MSEREPNYNAGPSTEFDSQEFEKLNEAAAEKRREAAEKAEAKKKSLELIRKNIEEAAASKEQMEVNQLEKEVEHSVLKASGQLKNIAVKQRIREVQRKETPAVRTFSKVVHQPVVEEISNIAESTVARPSGLLVGGIVSVISSLVVLYISRHYGYEYNFMIGLLGFAGGFVLGLILEGIWRLFKPRRH